MQPQKTSRWKTLLLGRRLANREQGERKLGVLAAVPAMGLDGLASSAYGPEAALTLLLPLGAGGPRYLLPITYLLLALLALLYLSYRQTIAAYPNGAGAYTVAKENLGTNAGLLAAAALLIDYVLNVAVGISAGIAALVSVFPAFHSYTLWLCLSALFLLTLVNLRGTKESGLAFALPTYLFLASFFVILGLGIFRLLAGGPPRPVIAPPPLGAASASAGAWLLMRAFASGCTAMTGVEAVSNGLSAFKEPPVRHAQRTLTVIVLCLGALLFGIAYLAHAFGIGAMDQTKPHYQSVLSQLVAAILGRNFFYFVAMGSLLAVLTLSANTSFVDFPRLCRWIAADRFLPKPFAVVGQRLVFSVGILFLSLVSGLLLVAFGGITDRLIPLFAVGAFLAFTLSQAGMVVHWWKRRESGGAARWHLPVNGAGALTTAVALLVIVAAKFAEGAWITLLALPALILLFKATRSYYDRVGRRLWEPRPLDLAANEPPVVVLPTEGWNQLTRKALRFGMRLSPEVIAVHLGVESGEENDEEEILQDQWRVEVERPAREAGVPAPRLVFLPSPYRRFREPLLRFLRLKAEEHPDRVIAVLLPWVIQRHWWQHLLHHRRAHLLRSALLAEGEPRLVVIEIPWDLERSAAPSGGPSLIARGRSAGR
jgi:amino acid transporter